MCLRGRGGGGIFVIWDPNPKSLHPVPKECGGGEGGMGGGGGWMFVTRGSSPLVA